MGRKRAKPATRIQQPVRRVHHSVLSTTRAEPPNTDSPVTISAAPKAVMPLTADQAPVQRADNENQIALDALSRFLDPQPSGPLKAAMQVRQADPNAARSRTLRFLAKEEP